MLLFEMSLTHPSPQTRLSALNAFTPPYTRYLSVPTSLSIFELFMKDEDSVVSRAALKVLGGVSKENPSLSYPMFRSVLFDTLFICTSNKIAQM
jgi:hypothetical protein